MESIIEYFSNIPSSHRTAILVGGLTIFLCIENAAPFFTTPYYKWKHAGINIFFTFTTIVVNFIMAFILINTVEWISNAGIGIVQWLHFPLWAVFIFGLMLMDLIGAYIPHYVEHKVRPLWQFHIIHHTDKNVDTTTANRHHPGESVIRFIFTMIAVVIVGAPIWLVFLYQSTSVVLSQFNHANIIMPTWVDKTILTIFCTPNMHRIHHHYRQPYSDSNYGNIFSIWDRMFGTFIMVDNAKIKYGLDTYPDDNESDNIWQLLKIPFQNYRHRIEYPQEEDLTKS